MVSQADFIFYGGNIITMDESNPSAEALAVKEDKIQAVGKFDEVFALVGPSTEVIYLNHQTLLPGFIEPHQHATMMATNRANINISGYNYKTYEDVKEVMTKEIAKLDPGASPLPWGRFFGWDPELIPNMPTLSADFLDEQFSSTFPVIIIGQSGHVAWVNHKAFEIAGIDIEKEEGDGFVKEDGKLTGQLFEAPAIIRVFRAAPQPTIHMLEKAVLEQWKEYSACGFTTVTDLGYMRNKPFDSVLETISLSNTCPVRLALYRMVEGLENAVSSSRCCPRLIPSGDYTVGF